MLAIIIPWMPLRLADFNYQLPSDLIAQTPAQPRDSSKLLVLDRDSGQRSHHRFSELPSLLHPTDVLVRNNTQVIPARVIGRKPSGGRVELLLLKRAYLSADQETWECLSKPGLSVNQSITISPQLTATCTQVDGYIRRVRFNLAGEVLLTTLLEVGQTPLPPYIAWSKTDEPELRQLYQTTYAKVAGSAAAPTAGLHFTPSLDQRLRDMGVQIEAVTLHVGLGTFLPVKESEIAHHHMHGEWFELQPDVAKRITEAKLAGRRIIAVGTTTCRVLETCADVTATGQFYLRPGSGETDIFMYPPYAFKCVSGLVTNFHLPQSTLLMLIAALTSVPNTRHKFTTFSESAVGRAYQAAIDDNYRFYSFGDAMLIS